MISLTNINYSALFTVPYLVFLKATGRRDGRNWGGATIWSCIEWTEL